jgi:flagellar biosynthetic protein FlhB
MAEQNLERTEQATPKRREEARRKGMVASSREIPSVAILLAALGVFAFFGPGLFHGLLETMGEIFILSGTATLDTEGVYRLFLMLSMDLLALLAPWILGLTLIGVSSHVAQVGLHVNSESFAFNASRINPIQGLKRLVSVRGWVEVIKGFLKIGLIGYLTYHFIHGEIGQLISLTEAGLDQVLIVTGKMAFRLMLWLSGMLLTLAVLDYAFQRWQYERDLRMTRQEIKEEYTQTEGNPMIKARIKAIQRALTRNRMIAEVAGADVVVTNPQHLAVALAYESRKMKAPKVVAKGAGFIAERIKKEAQKHRVPIVEDKPLAQTLYKSVEVGQEIPARLYKAVAEILAYVYRLAKHKATLYGEYPA